MKCTEPRGACPYQSRPSTGKSGLSKSGKFFDPYQNRYCTRCGKNITVKKENKFWDNKFSVIISDSDLFPSYFHRVSVSSRYPVQAAGRHLLVTNEAEVAGLSLQRFSHFTPKFRESLMSFWASVSLGSDSVYRPLFSAPHVYWMREGQIERINARQEGSLVPEVVVSSNDGRLSDTAEAIHTPEGTQIAWPMREHIGILRLDRYNEASSPNSYAEIKAKPKGRWYSPVFSPKDRHWIAVDTTGQALVIDPSNEEDPIKAFVSLAPEGGGRCSPPMSINGQVYAAYLHEGKSGLSRLTVNTGEVDFFQLSSSIRSLHQSTGEMHAPHRFRDSGAMWPTDDGKVFAIQSKDAGDGNLLDVRGASGLTQKHVVQLKDCLVAVQKDPNDSTVAQVISYTIANREIVGDVRVTITNSRPWDIKSLVLIPGNGEDPPGLLIQEEETVCHVYPTKK